MGRILEIIINISYVGLAMVALWSAYCVVTVLSRIRQKRFRNDKQMLAFLGEVNEAVAEGDVDGALEIVEGDRRALPQLIEVALVNRHLPLNQIRQLVVDKFQQDILADLQHRMSWIGTCIKAAPMVGLLGTVIGMMGAFLELSTSESVDAEALAGNIMVALIKTACGLSIAIPLLFCSATINIRIRKLEDSVAFGLARFFEVFKQLHDRGDMAPPKPAQPAETRFR